MENEFEINNHYMYFLRRSYRHSTIERPLKFPLLTEFNLCLHFKIISEFDYLDKQCLMFFFVVHCDLSINQY